MGGKVKVLIIEDIDIDASDIEDSLQELGYPAIDTVDSGKKALQLIDTSIPDIILIDMKLKGDLDGIETASIIREQYDIPFIYITDYADDYILQRAKKTEPGGYIIKPYRKEEINSAIEMTLYKRKMEHDIKQKEEFLSTTLMSINDAVITTDNAMKITFINPTAETLIGCKHNEALGKPAEQYYQVADTDRKGKAENPVAQVIKHQKKKTFDNQIIITKQNKTIQISSDISPIKNEKGKIIGSVIILRDTSEKKKIQEELLKAQKLESLANMAGSIGHEFNNLLAVIIGNIDLIKQTGTLNKTGLEDIEEAESAAKKAKDLARRLLDFSRQGEIVKRPVNTSRLIQESMLACEQTDPYSYEWTIPEDIWHIDGDENQLSQALCSVIKKICGLARINGKITIAAENAEINENNGFLIHTGKYVKIIIKEYGKRFPKEQLDTIFDPHFSASGTHGEISPDEIDLSIAYSIVKKHEGYITAESGMDETLSFSIFLPALTEIGIKSVKESAKIHRSKRNVLVMDDQELVRIIAGKILNHFGYDVEFARHGEEAVDVYKRNFSAGKPFSCVILDLTVEFGHGAKETIEKLIEIDPQVKAIVASGYLNDPIFFNYTKYGFYGVIKKPFDLIELNKIVHDVIEGN